MADDKLLKTMQVFDEYERRFALARAQKPLVFPLDDKGRQNILSGVEKLLRLDEKLIPTVSDAKVVRTKNCGTYTVYELIYSTWKNVYVSATAMIPKSNAPVPLVFVLCGHGKGGRRNEGYSLMAHRLARCGLAVIMPDNIGQGDRYKMGHGKDTASPFYAGLTIQGLIVAEAVALVRAAASHPKIDSARMGACGNSGGGMLTLFLSALAPQLSAIASSGYPSEFPFILSKEYVHCVCNLLSGAAYGPEMWEIYSLFAPKPLLLEQGYYDEYIPSTLAKRNARKIKHVYTQMGAEENFRLAITNTKHSWTAEDRKIISDFLCNALGIKDGQDINEENLPLELDEREISLPQNALTTDELVQSLTGKKIPKDLLLQDAIKPTFNGKELNPDEIVATLGGVDIMHVFAQMEFALKKQVK